MYFKRRWYGMLAACVVLTPVLALAQIQIQLPQVWPVAPEEQRTVSPPEHSWGESRGLLEVINDWKHEVKVTIWSHRRERIGAWSIPRGQNVNFVADGRRIKVRPHYKIKVGEDWGWVEVGQVGQFHQGVWYVKVRDIWRATHGARHEDRTEAPDWNR